MEARERLLGTVALAWVITICLCSGNQMHPHHFPTTRGPFFEGWYVRIVDHYTGLSVGFSFSRVVRDSGGHFSPKHPCIRPSLTPVSMTCPEDLLSLKESHHPSVTNITSHGYNVSSSIPFHANAVILISHTYTDNNNSNKSQIMAETEYFPAEEFSTARKVNPVTEEYPHVASAAGFEIRIGQNVSFIFKPIGTKFVLNLKDTTIRGETVSPLPPPHGHGTEGEEAWLEDLPHLHRSIYSLRSSVVYYEVTNKSSGLNIHGGSKSDRSVFAYIEKNWGNSFPEAWVMAQGMDGSSSTNASLFLSVAYVDELGVDNLNLKQSSNYRNPQKGINCRMIPSNSVFSFNQDSCRGIAVLHVKSLFCDILFEVQTDPKDFSHCLPTPLTSGYVLGYVESYKAEASVSVYERDGLEMILTDVHTFALVSLRFGGRFICEGKC